MFPVSNPLAILARCCARRPSGAAWAAPAKWWCSSTGRRAWKTWAKTASRTSCKSWTSSTRWNTRAKSWRRSIGKDHPDYKKRLRRWAKRLLKDKVQDLIEEARQECAGQPQAAAVEEALGYFVRNVSRMQYGTFRAAGCFIGSGVVEAGCKTVIGGRCKQSGMFWSESGAENILALRCIHSSRRLEEFWKYRLNEQAARNDTLTLAA